jgi:hypothetical protein
MSNQTDKKKINEELELELTSDEINEVKQKINKELEQYSTKKQMGIVDDQVSYHTVASLNQMKQKIIEELIQPAYYKDVKDTLEWRYTFRKWGNFSEGLSQLIIAASVILAFAAGVYDKPWLSFLSGSCGTIAGVFMKLTSYAHRESKERTQSLNIILDSLDMKQMPSIIQNNDMISNKKNMSHIESV